MISPIKIITYIKEKSFIRDTVSTTIFGTFGKFIGFLIPFFIAIWFGVSSETDAFFFAYGFVLFISAVFAPAIENIIVPFIVEKRLKKEDTGKFAGKILVYSGVGLLIISLLVYVIIRPILSLITDFNSETIKLVYLIFIEILPLIILITWSSVLVGYLNSYKRFTTPALSPAIRAIVNLLIIFLLKDFLGVHAIAIGYVVGEFFRIIFLFVFIRRFKLSIIKFSLKLNKELKNFFKVISFQVIGMIALGLNPMVDKTMASWLEEGSISILYYADRLYMIPITFMTVGLMTTTLSYWSNKYYSHRKTLKNLVKNLKKIIIVSSIVSIIITLILIIFSKNVVNITFGKGISDSNLLSQIRTVWIFYLFGFVPSIILRIFRQTHLALKNTKFLMLCGFGSFFLNIILNYFLMQRLEVSGIALATSITSIIWCIVYGLVLFRNLKVKNF